MSHKRPGMMSPSPSLAPSDGSVAPPGLSSTDAARRRSLEGPNRLPRQKPTSPLRLIAAQLTHLFAVMLWVAAALAWVGGMPSLALGIVVVVFVNAGFAFAQEYRADRAADQLQALMPSRATVRRDGHRQVISAEELVVGDVLLLEAGDRVSADVRVTYGNRLAVDQSLLTGESAPVHLAGGDAAYAGTFVVEGEAETLVTAVGSRTRLAGIAALTRRTRRPPGPLAIQLNRVVRVVAGVALGVGVSFFIVSAILGMPLAQGFLFAVGVTVALVPEGLLPTVTLSLALAAHGWREPTRWCDGSTRSRRSA